VSMRPASNLALSSSLEDEDMYVYVMAWCLYTIVHHLFLYSASSEPGPCLSNPWSQIRLKHLYVESDVHVSHDMLPML